MSSQERRELHGTGLSGRWHGREGLETACSPFLHQLISAVHLGVKLNNIKLIPDTELENSTEVTGAGQAENGQGCLGIKGCLSGVGQSTGFTTSGLRPPGRKVLSSFS